MASLRGLQPGDARSIGRNASAVTLLRDPPCQTGQDGAPDPPSTAPAAAIPAAAANAAARAAADSGPAVRKLDAEEIGKRLLRLLESLRVQSLSLHNVEGELLWLSEGVFGPDEHGYVLDALDVFSLEPARQFIERRVEDGRRAFFLCARTPLGDRCGLAALIIEAHAGVPVESHLSSPRVASIMRRFSMLLAPARTPGAPPAAPRVIPTLTPAPKAKAAPATKAAAAKAQSAAKAAAPKPAPAAKAEPTPKPAPRAVASATPRLIARRYTRLRAGGVTYRYEVLWGAGARPAGGPMSVDLALSALITEHLQAFAERYQREPASFLVPLSVEAVRGKSFFEELRPLLQRADLEPGILGFSLPPAAWSEAPQPTQIFLEQCKNNGCFAAFEDFQLSRPGFALLNSPAVRCVKLEPALIASVMTDKFSQATVAAIVQAARVLGVYCVAKDVPSLAVAQWLVSAGIEFTDNATRAGTVGATTDSLTPLETPG